MHDPLVGPDDRLPPKNTLMKGFEFTQTVDGLRCLRCNEESANKFPTHLLPQSFHGIFSSRVLGLTMV